jgi:hypothetical protein
MAVERSNGYLYAKKPQLVIAGAFVKRVVVEFWSVLFSLKRGRPA